MRATHDAKVASLIAFGVAHPQGVQEAPAFIHSVQPCTCGRLRRAR
jgi:hypothetical protein